MLRLDRGEVCERFTIRGEFRGEPAFRAEVFRVGVEDGVATQPPFEGETCGVFRDEIAFVYIVLFEDVWNTWRVWLVLRFYWILYCFVWKLELRQKGAGERGYVPAGAGLLHLNISLMIALTTGKFWISS